jgi:hypothetical protein
VDELVRRPVARIAFGLDDDDLLEARERRLDRARPPRPAVLPVVPERHRMPARKFELGRNEAIEGGEKRREARAVALEHRERGDDRLDRREAVRGRLATDPIRARRRRSQRDPRQRA